MKAHCRDCGHIANVDKFYKGICPVCDSEEVYPIEEDDLEPDPEVEK